MSSAEVRLIVLSTVNVLPSAIVSVEPVAGVVIVTLLMVLFVSDSVPLKVTSPTARLPLPTIELLLTVLIFVPETSVSCTPVTAPTRPLTLDTGPAAMLAALAAAATALLLALVALLAAAVALLDADVALLDAEDADEAAADADADASLAFVVAVLALVDADVALLAAAVALAEAAVLSELFSAFCAFSSLIMLVCHVKCACMAASKATGSPPYLSGGLVPGGVDTATVILAFLIYSLRWIMT